MNIASKLALMGSLGAAAVALIGCTDNSRTVVETSSEQTGIAAVGRGDVVVKSDTGFFDVGVQVTAKTVAEARERGAKSADAVISSLKRDGIDEKDIKTTGLSIEPQYNYPRDGGQPTITGYHVVNTVSVKVRKLDDFSKVLDNATLAGGNDARVSGIRFGVEDNAKALDQAREAAMADAKKKAEQLAKLGGVSLGAPLAISEGVSQESKPQEALFRAPATGVGNTSTPIQPGTGTVTVEVSVRWAIK